MYKEALKLKLRFSSSKGELTTEQLWDLKLKELDTMAVELYNQQTQVGSFLTNKQSFNTEDSLRLNILKDVIQTKEEENRLSRQQQENKARKEQLAQILERKQNSQLEELSVEELTSMLKNLS